MERADPAGSPSSQNLTGSAANDTNILTATLPEEEEEEKERELRLPTRVGGASAAPHSHKRPTSNWVAEGP